MKNGKCPTRRQKDAISSIKLNPDNWLVSKATAGKLHIVHRDSGKIRIISA